MTPASLVTRDTGLLELGAGAVAGAVVTRPVLLSSCWTSRDILMLLAHSSGKYTCSRDNYGEYEPDVL